jgi:hypothetical protein
MAVSITDAFWDFIITKSYIYSQITSDRFKQKKLMKEQVVSLISVGST